MLCLRLLLHKRRHLSSVMHQLPMRSPLHPLLVMNDIRTHRFQKCRIVTHNQHSRLFQPEQIVLQPLDRFAIQVICRLVQEHDVGADQDCLGQPQLHLPSTGQFPDGAVHHGLGEFEIFEYGSAFGIGFARGRGEVGENDFGFVDGVDVGAGVDVFCFEVDGPAFEFAVVDCVHESGFSDSILSNESIAMPSPQTKLRLVKQNLPTIRQRETYIGQLLPAKLILLIGRIVIVH
mmetsp:Transcript_19796/g.39096  ORF Transcript_19796/g.39096 Transcript_19796/m.39096 type:complete len:233 (-) Transcript_19796:492-1190(-)